MAKYQPLADHLMSLPASELTVTLTFAQVSNLVGELPPTAYRLRQWWANDSKPQARAWRSGGWRVDERGIDFNAGTVRFARGKVGGGRARLASSSGGGAGLWPGVLHWTYATGIDRAPEAHQPGNGPHPPTGTTRRQRHQRGPHPRAAPCSS